MAKPFVVSSRKRTLSDPCLQSSTSGWMSQKKKKTDQEEPARSFNCLFNKENTPSQSMNQFHLAPTFYNNERWGVLFGTDRILGGKTYKAPCVDSRNGDPTMISRKDEVEYEEVNWQEALRQHNKIVPAHLLNKKYDTSLPRQLRHGKVFVVALPATGQHGHSKSFNSMLSSEYSDSDRQTEYEFEITTVSSYEGQNGDSEFFDDMISVASSDSDSQSEHELEHTAIGSYKAQHGDSKSFNDMLSAAYSDSDRHSQYEFAITTVDSYKDKQIQSIKIKSTFRPPPSHGRRMISSTKSASNLQKCIPGYPTTDDPFPADFTLTELCQHYPNHLFGDNLRPFIQHNWPSTKMFHLLPSQDGMPETEKITVAGIASRLRKVKLALEKSGEYAAFMKAPKTHTEE